MLKLGKAAYEGYYKSSNGRSIVSNEALPIWEALRPSIQIAWNAAAQAVVESITKHLTGVSRS